MLSYQPLTNFIKYSMFVAYHLVTNAYNHVYSIHISKHRVTATFYFTMAVNYDQFHEHFTIISYDHGDIKCCGHFMLAKIDRMSSISNRG